LVGRQTIPVGRQAGHTCRESGDRQTSERQTGDKKTGSKNTGARQKAKKLLGKTYIQQTETIAKDRQTEESHATGRQQVVKI
jgi:hypothetical protein